MPAQLVYYIATTLDGRIAALDGSYDAFLNAGPHADEFVEAIDGFTGVLMGRKTYEVGLKAGLPFGQPAYPGRANYVFSKTLTAPTNHSKELTFVSSSAAAFVATLKQQHEGRLWLCGGGELAGSLIEAGLIDALRLKINPVLLGDGRPLASALTRSHHARLHKTTVHSNGVVVAEYELEASETSKRVT
ncbi:MAG: dihydrofolate reductase family protein [Myxococcota bacterium]